MVADLQAVTDLANTLQIEMFSIDKFESEGVPKVEQIKMECFDDSEYYDNSNLEELEHVKEENNGKMRMKQETSEETRMLNKQRAERAGMIRQE